MVLFIFIIIFLSIYELGLNQLDPNKFGPYRLHWHKFEACKGPKHSDCGKFQVIANVQNMSDVVFILDMIKDCPITQARVTISSKQNDTTKKLWNYALDKPCQHFVLGPILIEAFNLTQNCQVNKGKYEVHLDMIERSRAFLSSKFFYGDYIFKTIGYNKYNNFMCVFSLLSVEKF